MTGAHENASPDDAQEVCEVDHEAFFKRLRNYELRAKFYECSSAFTAEELYQAFAARLKKELKL